METQKRIQSIHGGATIILHSQTADLAEQFLSRPKLERFRPLLETTRKSMTINGSREAKSHLHLHAGTEQLKSMTIVLKRQGSGTTNTLQKVPICEFGGSAALAMGTGFKCDGELLERILMLDRLSKNAFMSLFTLVILIAQAEGRTREHWSHARLWQESEVVCLASVSKIHPDEKNDWRPNEFKKLVASINVETVLKGRIQKERPEVVVYRWHNPPTTIANGPNFAKLPVGELREKEGPFNGARVLLLLFLKRLPDGRYVPTSGNLDSELSVMKVSSFADEQLNIPGQAKGKGALSPKPTGAKGTNEEID